MFTRLTGYAPRIYQCKKSPVYKPDGSCYLNPKTFIHNITVSSLPRVLTVLKAIEPHLVGEKRDRARLVIRFAERRVGRKGPHTKHGPSWYDAHDWSTVAEFYTLKKRPIPLWAQGVLNEHERTQLRKAG